MVLQNEQSGSLEPWCLFLFKCEIVVLVLFGEISMHTIEVVKSGVNGTHELFTFETL